MTTFTRRRFLQGLGAGGALLAVGCGGSSSPSGGVGGTPPATIPKNPILIVIDLADPTRPVLAGKFWLPGMHTAAGEHANWPMKSPDGIWSPRFPPGRWGVF